MYVCIHLFNHLLIYLFYLLVFIYLFYLFLILMYFNLFLFLFI